MRFLDQPSSRWRYLADASFAVYIAHLPVSYTMSTLVMRWPLHWSVKFILILGVTTVVTFSIYQLLVRSTFVGQFLNGRKKSGGWNSPAGVPQRLGAGSSGSAAS